MLVFIIAGLLLTAAVLGAWLVTHPKFLADRHLRSRMGLPERATWQTRETASPVFLFEHSQLTQTNAAAIRLLGKSQTGTIGWPEVREILVDIVPNIPISLNSLSEGSTVYPEQSEPLSHHLSIESHPPFTRVELQMGQMPLYERPGQECMDAPFPIWAQDTTGTVIWKNRAYGKAGFTPRLVPKSQGGRKSGKRFSIPAGNGRPAAHYRLFTKSFGESVVHYAHSAQDAAAAEASRQDVVQTLGKTFAHLSTGLVVFDNEGNLVLFNPAVIDLFGFSASFLSAKPSLQSFFDHMRDNRMIPEPKNYTQWRAQMLRRFGSKETQFQENWQLPSGATIRATGQPSPDGGMGFMFEDISSQVSTTRRFRDELALSHTLLDSLDEAIAAIDSLGRVVFTNKAFQTHWKVDPDSSFVDFTAGDLIKVLQRDIPKDQLNRISDYLSRSDTTQEVSIPFFDADQKAAELNLSRARGQLIILRHSVPAKATESQKTILVP